MRRFLVVSLTVVAALAGTAGMAQAQYYGPGWGPPGPPPGYGPPRGGGGAFCAVENQFCGFRGPATVRYGARGRYVERRAFNGIPCSNEFFGDPAPGVPKRCFIAY